MRRLLAGFCVLAGLVLGLQPASAATVDYVALGDSYSSGVGTRSYLADGTSCQRSIYAYPSLLATARGYALTLRACSGATVADVRSTQLSALSAQTGYVTVSAGGNDAGFADVITQCALPAWASDCLGRINSAEAVVRNDLPGRLAALYADIRARAPQASVAVVGYPRLFNGRDCNAFTWFSGTEMSRLNAAADLLNATLKQRALAAGFSFADPTSPFIGHAVCDRTEWINGLSLPISESFHPNRSGQASGYLPVVGASLPSQLSPAARSLATTSGSQARLLATVRGDAARIAATLTAGAWPYAAADAKITPKLTHPVDLHSPQVLAAAARAGVDVDNRASVDEADRRYAAAQASTLARSSD